MKEEFSRFLDGIRLRQNEEYDCTTEDICAFRSKNDSWKDIKKLSLGNMCNGFSFTLGGLEFHNSECAYIAGAYAGSDPDSIRIQRLIAEERNGLKAKRIYRNREEYMHFMRRDWNEYNVQYMLYVVWQKTVQNDDFANLLRKIPVDCQVVENSTFQKGHAANFWGASNTELLAIRKVNGKKAARGVYDKGCYTGYNVMGKIIKICSLCLLSGDEAPVDFELLNQKNLYIKGKRLEFPKVRYEGKKLGFILNARSI